VEEVAVEAAVPKVVMVEEVVADEIITKVQNLAMEEEMAEVEQIQKVEMEETEEDPITMTIVMMIMTMNHNLQKKNRMSSRSRSSPFFDILSTNRIRCCSGCCFSGNSMSYVSYSYLIYDARRTNSN
jgi:hypothetical protein